MATACIPQITFGFEPKAKPVVATFDMPHASSDGGAVLLKSLDTQLQNLPPQWTANAWYLERRHPEEWGRREGVEHAGAVETSPPGQRP